jgi:hypothetical protein
MRLMMWETNYDSYSSILIIVEGSIMIKCVIRTLIGH